MFFKLCRPPGTNRAVPAKTLLVKKITTLLLLLTCLYASARDYSQRAITLKVDHATMESVFNSIEGQSGFTFLFVNNQVAKAKPVTLDVVNMPLEKVLESCFKDQPLTFKILEEQKIIVIKAKGEDEKKDNASQVPPGTVKGKVINEKGEPLPGVTVTVKGMAKATQTDEKGNFLLTNIDPNAVLVFTAVNVETYEFSLSGQRDIMVTLISQSKNLDEVQVIAYGTTTRRISTGNITTVKASEIEKQPVSNVLLALEGRVPGMTITQNTGIHGGGITVRIQGQNSIGNGNDPLYIIDGIPYLSQSLPNISGVSGILGTNGNNNNTSIPSGGGNPLSFLNPADIEAISILKDADATSIYGSRAAAGAVIITTKKGQGGKVKMDANFQIGWGKVTRFTQLLSTKEYLEMRHEAKSNDNASILPTDYDINGTWDTSRYTDWQKVLLGNTAHFTDGHVSISGGERNTQYLLGLGYHDETTVFPANFEAQNGSVHFNLNHSSNNQKFKAQFSGNYMVDVNNIPYNDLTGLSLKIAPVAPPIFNVDGSLNWQPLSNGNSSWYNPMAQLLRTYRINSNNLISNAWLGYELLPGLVIKANLGFTKLTTNETQINPLISYAPELRATTTRFSNISNSETSSWILEPQITYKKRIGPGTLDILLGTTFFNNENTMELIRASGFNNDLSMPDIKSASSILITQTVSSIYNYNAFFGRLNYNIGNKYIINLTARRDGSSRFGSENLFQNFGSIGAAYIISNEPFFKKNLPLISIAKIKSSYGTTGNDQIGDYKFLSLYNAVSVASNYQGAVGLGPNGIPNPYLQWEVTRKFSAGIDLGIMEDRFLVSATYFRNRSSNQLISYSLPYSTGFSSISQNLPALVQNTGLEFSLNFINIKKKNLLWTTSINITIPSNKLVSYPNLETSSYASSYIVGQPFSNSLKYFSYNNVDPTSGLFTFLDRNGTSTSAPLYPQDLIHLVNKSPAYFGGFQNDIKIGAFELSCFFQFVKQEGSNYILGTRPGSFTNLISGQSVSANQPVFVMNRWRQVGDIAQFQKFSSTYPSNISTPYSNAGISDLSISDASFIRLKNLSLAFNLPNSITNRIHLNSAKVFILCQNILTITKFKGLDPEQQSTSNLPPLAMATFGAHISF